MSKSISIDAPRPIGTPEYVYDVVLRMLRDRGVGNVLDCPAGNGAFTKKLLDAGLAVEACDINCEGFQLKEHIRCQFGDMNNALPYNDEQFDSIVCLNGMHRVWARGRVMREFARTLRDNGHVIITNVNNVNLLHRVCFFVCGSSNYNTIGPPYGFLPEANNPAAWFRAPLTVAEVVHVAKCSGFVVDEVAAIKWSMKCTLGAPLALIAWVGASFLPKRFRQYGCVADSNCMAALFSDYIAIVLRKNG